MTLVFSHDCYPFNFGCKGCRYKPHALVGRRVLPKVGLIYGRRHLMLIITRGNVRLTP